MFGARCMASASKRPKPNWQKSSPDSISKTGAASTTQQSPPNLRTATVINQHLKLNGIPIMVSDLIPEQKATQYLQCSDSTVSLEFRRDFDRWLFEFFPTEPCVIIAESSQGKTICVHPTNLEYLKSQMEQQA